MKNKITKLILILLMIITLGLIVMPYVTKIPYSNLTESEYYKDTYKQIIQNPKYKNGEYNQQIEHIITSIDKNKDKGYSVITDIVKDKHVKNYKSLLLDISAISDIKLDQVNIYNKLDLIGLYDETNNYVSDFLNEWKDDIFNDYVIVEHLWVNDNVTENKKNYTKIVKNDMNLMKHLKLPYVLMDSGSGVNYRKEYVDIYESITIANKKNLDIFVIKAVENKINSSIIKNNIEIDKLALIKNGYTLLSEESKKNNNSTYKTFVFTRNNKDVSYSDIESLYQKIDINSNKLDIFNNDIYIKLIK